jgi:hypothetical protein
MAFLKAVQNVHAEAYAEFQLASKVYSNACKVYTPYRLAASHPLSSEKAIVEEFKARKIYKEACRAYHLARAKFVGAVREQAINSGEIRVSDMELSETMIRANQAAIIEHSRQNAFARGISERDIVMAKAVVNRLPGEDPEQAAARALEEYDRQRSAPASSEESVEETEVVAEASNTENVSSGSLSSSSPIRAVQSVDFTLDMSDTL